MAVSPSTPSLSTSPTANNDAQLDETMDFFKYSHIRSNNYAGTVAFKLKYDDGSDTIRYVRVHPRSGVSVFKQSPADGHISCEVTMDRDTFFEVYMGKMHPRRAAFTGKMSVRKFRFNELSRFAEAFDVSTEKWVQFYKYRATLGIAPACQWTPPESNSNKNDPKKPSSPSSSSGSAGTNQPVRDPAGSPHHLFSPLIPSLSDFSCTKHSTLYMSSLLSSSTSSIALLCYRPYLKHSISQNHRWVASRVSSASTIPTSLLSIYDTSQIWKHVAHSSLTSFTSSSPSSSIIPSLSLTPSINNNLNEKPSIARDVIRSGINSGGGVLMPLSSLSSVSRLCAISNNRYHNNTNDWLLCDDSADCGTQATFTSCKLLKSLASNAIHRVNVSSDRIADDARRWSHQWTRSNLSSIYF